MSAVQSKHTNIAYWLMIASYLTAIVTLVLTTYANTPETIESLWLFFLGGLGITLTKVLPLLLFIPGLIARKHSTSAWLCYMSMLYFILGVLLAFTPGAALLGWVLTISSLVIFLSSMLYTRWAKADIRAAESN